MDNNHYDNPELNQGNFHRARAPKLAVGLEYQLGRSAVKYVEFSSDLTNQLPWSSYLQ